MVIATNIAETSLTIDGICYVVDSGYVKQKTYDPKKDMEVLKPIRVSQVLLFRISFWFIGLKILQVLHDLFIIQAQAIQRTGRAGRVGPGICFRLYSEKEFNGFSKSPNPEISRASLTNCVIFYFYSAFHYVTYN